MTNAVCASVLFLSTPSPDEDESLLQSIQQLLLTPHNDDEDVDDNGHGEVENEGNRDNSNVSYIHIHDNMLMILCMLST